MKCIQFTDIHIGLEGEKTFDADVRQNMRRIVDAISAEQADVIVLTGDLCFREPHDEIYRWLKQVFRISEIDPLIVPGNHDNRQMLRSHFTFPKTPDGQIYYAREWNGYPVIFLDTTDAVMSERQWDWLEQQLENASDEVIIFMHHPPAYAGVPYMDSKHMFREQDRFRTLISRMDVEAHVFCGHYHVDKTISIKNLHVFITPSCFFQIRQDIEEFGIDHYRIGYRIINLNHTQIRHTVRYLG